MLLALHQAGTISGLTAQALKQFTPYSDAQADLRCSPIGSPARRAARRRRSRERWADMGCASHDAAIRARVAGGDEDSIIHLLLFGTSFTKAPRASERDLADLVDHARAALRALGPRIDDFAAAVATPGTNDRLRFARQVVERKGIDPRTDSGKAELRRYLEERTQVVGGSIQSSRLLDPATDVSDKLTVFRERGPLDRYVGVHRLRHRTGARGHEGCGRAAGRFGSPRGDRRPWPRLHRQARRLRLLSGADHSAVRAD